MDEVVEFLGHGPRYEIWYQVAMRSVAIVNTKEPIWRRATEALDRYIRVLISLLYFPRLSAWLGNNTVFEKLSLSSLLLKSLLLVALGCLLLYQRERWLLSCMHTWFTSLVSSGGFRWILPVRLFIRLSKMIIRSFFKKCALPQGLRVLLMHLWGYTLLHVNFSQHFLELLPFNFISWHQCILILLVVDDLYLFRVSSLFSFMRLASHRRHELLWLRLHEMIACPTTQDFLEFSLNTCLSLYCGRSATLSKTVL